jgi:hypothetical protein
MIVRFDPAIAPWVAQQCGQLPAQAHISVAEARDGQIVTGAYFAWVTETNAFVHFASVGAVSKGFIAAGLRLAFDLGLERLSFLLLDSQKRLARLAKAVGAVLECTLRRGHSDGDAQIYVLWLKGARYV